MSNLVDDLLKENKVCRADTVDILQVVRTAADAVRQGAKQVDVSTNSTIGEDRTYSVMVRG